jgi:hypothetical protein
VFLVFAGQDEDQLDARNTVHHNVNSILSYNWYQRYSPDAHQSPWHMLAAIRMLTACKIVFNSDLLRPTQQLVPVAEIEILRSSTTAKTLPHALLIGAKKLV